MRVDFLKPLWLIGIVIAAGCDAPSPKAKEQADQELDQVVSLEVDEGLPTDQSVDTTDSGPLPEPSLPPCEDGKRVYCERGDAETVDGDLSAEQLAQCALPYRVCLAGEWSDCRQPLERCDDLDNDCDGQVDETFAVGEACIAGVG